MIWVSDDDFKCYCNWCFTKRASPKLLDSLIEVRNMLWIVHDCSMLASHHLYFQRFCAANSP